MVDRNTYGHEIGDFRVDIVAAMLGNVTNWIWKLAVVREISLLRDLRTDLFVIRP